MAHYALITLVIKDQEKLAAYLKVGGPAVAKHNGKAIAGGPDAQPLQTPHGETKGVVLQFPSAEHVTAWLNDPDLADIHALRNEAADTTILSLPQLA
ncbi:DUF1330 domain-containing protein [Maritalea mediterranea]|uniref:DUF1330 domain-containing protein n=1 Tax=Maritalea mediterranea TaxID=2909667 RepID=A0ABS9E9L9_9HYPH|nr:DUF1330 domain-containing protein [Maritalea mediterranea]MCF4099575.1 DUF1330 domain-containing protein [Maritalea mediterranea]